jgi:hypothetical protein
VVAAALAVVAYASVAGAQEASRSDETTNERSNERQTVGTVTTVGRASMVVHTDEGAYVVYALEPSFTRIPSVEPGTRVRVTTAANDTEPAPTALAIETLPARQGLAQQRLQTVPADVQRLESQLERQARRFNIGLTGGVALDPELISVSGFTTYAPFRQRGILVRPNVELAFGELTTLLGFHVDGLYLLPGISRSIRWAPYVGAGPNFTFSHRGVDEDEFIGDPSVPEIDNDRFDFSQWDWNNGFNFIVGARNPNGTFFELKATAWSVSTIRMLGGFQF